MADGGVGNHWFRYAGSHWLSHCHQSPVCRKVGAGLPSEHCQSPVYREVGVGLPSRTLVKLLSAGKRVGLPSRRLSVLSWVPKTVEMKSQLIFSVAPVGSRPYRSADTACIFHSQDGLYALVFKWSVQHFVAQLLICKAVYPTAQ